MIFFCEVNKTGHEHVMVNSCMLQMIAKLDFPEQIRVWIDKKHIEHFPDVPENLDIKLKNVIKPQKSNKWRWILKIFSEILLISQIVFSAWKERTSLVFFTSLSPVGLWYLSLFTSLVGRNVKFIVALHGELELAKPKNWTKKIENIYGKALRSTFKKNKTNLKFLILSSIVSSNIIKHGLLTQQQIICIEHPYIFPERNLADKHASTKPIVFGHLGVAKLNKQSQLFFLLAEAMQKYVLDNMVKFVIVGQVFDELKPFINEYVTYTETDSFISRSEYDFKSMEIDYAMFFYNDESYEFTSSGAIMDAISYQKPIIGLNIKLLRDLFGAHQCEPGYLFDDFDQMKNSMEQIIKLHIINYDNQVKCIGQKKDLYSITAQYPIFEQQVIKFLNS